LAVKISVVGLGKLGAPLCAVLASKGHDVVGVDLNPAFVDAINAGRAPVSEPGLADLVSANASRLRATSDFKDAVTETDATFVIVPTPSEEDGTFSLKYVLAAMQSVGQAIAAKSSYHLVTLTSTVMPGATDLHVLPALESASGKRCGAEFGVCYSPEFIALGSVIRDMLHPDMILIGESDSRAGDMLATIQQSVAETNPPVVRMNFVNAELTKIAVNTYVTTKISYANMLARVCEQIAGADADVVTQALGLDSRIGKKYLKGAVGYGGPCFPRDNRAFAALARHSGTPATLAEATDTTNNEQTSYLAQLIDNTLSDIEGGVVAILGLSYKPNTDVVEASPGLDLARALLDRDLTVIAHDPAAMDNARRVGPSGLTFAATADDAIAQADTIILLVGWDVYRGLSPQLLKGKSRRATIIDCWRMLDAATFGQVADYIALGKGPTTPALTR
jgi:UDPglucose 6-dehydrogenase